MKVWKKTSPELTAAFDKAVPASPTVTRRPMFGYASAFVNGNMFAGTFQDAIVVRLAETDRAALLKLKGAAPFAPMGHPMKEYVVVPPSIVANPNALSAWIERGHRYGVTLPAKSATKTGSARKTAAAKQTTAPKRAATTKSARGR
ncbi:MAG: TfoX/Sxy family protein [Chloroflexota bacterium]|nr:TfoX/Sxy family protein [Chloroflexota bacterium]